MVTTGGFGPDIPYRALPPSALGAVDARLRLNRQRLAIAGTCALCLAMLVGTSLLLPRISSAPEGDWLSFVTLPAGLLLLWTTGRLIVLVAVQRALLRDRHDIQGSKSGRRPQTGGASGRRPGAMPPF